MLEMVQSLAGDVTRDITLEGRYRLQRYGKVISYAEIGNNLVFPIPTPVCPRVILY